MCTGMLSLQVKIHQEVQAAPQEKISLHHKILYDTLRFIALLCVLSQGTVTRVLETETTVKSPNRQSYSCPTLLMHLEAAISYLRFADEQGAVYCSLVMGRARNALVKSLESLIDKVFMWSDLKTVLQYIANQTKCFHTFVSNRVA